MGSDCEIAVTDTHGTRSAPDLLVAGIELVQLLERCWSRFLPDSDVCRVNANAGRWTAVSPCTRNAVMLAAAGRDHTAGRYNPLLGRNIEDLGYDCPFNEVVTRRTLKGPADNQRTGNTADDIDIDGSANRVRIPDGTALDLGGIGKGYAGDFVADALLALGATGVMVNLGGDVRVAGDCPAGDHWSIQVGHRDEVVLLDDGAVAFTTTDKRRWTHNETVVHHLLDPLTGSSLTTDVPMVCVVSAAGWWSEVLTKSIAVQLTRQPAMMATLDEVVPGGAHAIVSLHGSTNTTNAWNSVSARYVHV